MWQALAANAKAMNIRVKYFLIGALFGMCFPVGAIIFELQRLSLSLNADSLSVIHEQNMILYMIDSAPLFLGLFALFGGISKERSVKLIHQLRQVGQILSENSDLLQSQTEQSLSRFVEATEQLSHDYSSIESLNRATYGDVSTTIQSTNDVTSQVDHMRNSLVELSAFNTRLEKSNEAMKDYFLTYLEKLDSMQVFFNYLKDFSRQIELLAVNSSIEANRYGAEGKAFLIFAQNIHDLANETRNRNDKIMALQRELSEETRMLRELVDSEHASLENMSKLVLEVDQSSGHFSSILSGFIEKLRVATNNLDTQNSLTSRFSGNLEAINDNNTDLINELRQIVGRQVELIKEMDKL